VRYINLRLLTYLLTYFVAYRLCVASASVRVWVLYSIPELVICVANAVTARCGEEIGKHVTELGRRILSNY